MHARVDELLSLRDGEPVGAEIAPHVAACAACTQEMSRLRGLRRRLRALPAAARPAGTWDAILGRAYPASAGRRRRQLAVFGTAASILVAASTAWILRDVPAEAPAPAGEPAARIADEAMKPDLVRRSMALEDALRALDYQPGIVRGSTAGTIAEIEDRIALVDYQLTNATRSQLTHTQSERLWRQRVDLLGSLVQVRYAQAQQAAY
ncbi:MAG: hypothetical protein H0W33_01985 [Gammaproteobacteria bacterium]|nr:hypothetical protein [Gammaproteobacteria bacterium]